MIAPAETMPIALRRGPYGGRTMLAGVPGVWVPDIYPNGEARYVLSGFFLDDMRCYLWDPDWVPTP